MIKNLLFYCFFLIGFHFGFSQTTNETATFNEIKTNYNNQEFETIFEKFSPEMKEELPLKETNKFFIQLFQQVGKIEQEDFIEYNESFATYKTLFDKGTLSFNFSLDEKNRINGLFIAPYQETIAVTNAITQYPANTKEILFSKTNAFPNKTQLSIAYIQNGKVNYYGIQKSNDSIISIQNHNKVFEIGSITKVFTSTVLADLVVNKKLKLTDNINTFYPFHFYHNQNISFQELANHTSGLPRLPSNLDLSNFENPYKEYGKPKLEEYLKYQLKVPSKTAKSYDYSNLGTGLLGYTLGLSQKKSFQELLRKSVLNRYKMSQTYFSAKELDNQLIKGQNELGEIISNWDFDALFAAGGLLSTIEDLTKFALAHFDSKNKSLALTRISTYTNKTTNVALGWHLIKTKNGNEFIWHNGGTGGYSSSIAINPSNQSAVIILSNLSSFHPKNENIDQICFELMNILND